MGKHVEPWWTIRFMCPSKIGYSAHIWHLKIGPMMFEWSHIGYPRVWHFYRPRWVGTQITKWMDGDCF